MRRVATSIPSLIAAARDVQCTSKVRVEVRIDVWVEGRFCFGRGEMTTRGLEHGFEVYGARVRKQGSSRQGVIQAQVRVRDGVLGLGLGC